MAGSYMPKGYHSVTPYLIVKGANDAIEFYGRAFGATEVLRLPGPEGKVVHAEIQLGDSRVMLADELPEMGYRGPATLGATTVSLMLYVPDVDRQFEQAIAAGATLVRPVADQFYGDRAGTLLDPFGHMWTLATCKEELSTEEMMRRFEVHMASGKGVG